MADYIRQLAGCALICGAVYALVRDTHASGQIRLLCALVMALAAAGPMAELDVDELTDFAADIRWEAEDAAALGHDGYTEALRTQVKAELEAYVQRQAAELGAVIAVTVSLDEAMLPQEVLMTGPITASQRRTLSQLLETELSIPKERQLWSE